MNFGFGTLSKYWSVEELFLLFPELLQGDSGEILADVTMPSCLSSVIAVFNYNSS
jgi:hypothetical protein